MSDRRQQLRLTALVLALIGLAAGLAPGLYLVARSARPLAGPAASPATGSAAAPARRLESALWQLVAIADRYAEGDPGAGRDAVDQGIEALSRAIAEVERSVAASRPGSVADGSGPLQSLQHTLGEREAALRALPPGQLAEYAPIRTALAEAAPALAELARAAEASEAADAAAWGAIRASRLTLGAWLIGLGALAAAAAVGLLLAGSAAARRPPPDPADDAARREARRFRALAEALPTAIVLLDRTSGVARYENPAATTLLGAPGRTTALARIGEALVDMTQRQAATDIGAATRLDRREVRLRRPDGAEFPAAISVRPIDDDGTPCSLVELADLTDLRSAREEDEHRREIRHQRDKLDALGSLLAGVAHELNNPLSVVVAQATMLEELSADPGAVARGQKIRGAAERCARIVKSFLSTARQRPPAPVELDLNQVVDATLESLAPGLAAGGVAISRERRGPLPPISADAEQLRQVLSHLVVNAEQAMADWPGPRRLTVTTRLDPGTGMVELAVADSGPGVAAAIKPRIFEPFFTTKPVGLGTGIGLSVCDGIVNSHGGSIAVEDAPGGGARFVVRLPAGGATAVASQPSPAGGRHLLIVDDEPDVRDTLAEILARDGYRIDMADGGRAALERIGSHRYDAVVSDIRMPDVDGVMLYHKVRELGTGLHERFIVVTGDTLSPSIRDFLDEARLPCIDKPFVPAEVRRLVGAVAAGARH